MSISTDSCIPSIFISSACIDQILRTIQQNAGNDGNSFFGYLIGNVEFQTFSETPQIKIIELVNGIENKSNMIFYPPPLKKNQIAIYYNSIFYEDDKELEETDMIESFSHVLQTHQIVYDQINHLYKMTCEHHIFPTHSVFNFYFPVHPFTLSLVESGSTPMKMKNNPNEDPELKLSVSNSNVDAFILNISGPSDPVLKPILTQLLCIYHNLHIRIGINNKYYEVHIEESPNIKLYYASCTTQSESFSLSFGRVGMLKDENLQINQFITKVHEKSTKLKSDIKEEISKDLSQQLNDTFAGFANMLSDAVKHEFSQLSNVSNSIISSSVTPTTLYFQPQTEKQTEIKTESHVGFVRRTKRRKV